MLASEGMAVTEGSDMSALGLSLQTWGISALAQRFCLRGQTTGVPTSGPGTPRPYRPNLTPLALLRALCPLQHMRYVRGPLRLCRWVTSVVRCGQSPLARGLLGVTAHENHADKLPSAGTTGSSPPAASPADRVRPFGP